MVHLADLTIAVRGAGSVGTAIALRLWRAGLCRICLFEKAWPLSIRRMASFAEAAIEGFATVEGVTAALAEHPGQLPALWSEGCIGLLPDPACLAIRDLRPQVCIDASSSQSGGFLLTDAPLVIGLRPAHVPGVQAHVVIETSGPGLGRVFEQVPDTRGTGDMPSGEGFILYAPREGIFRTGREIGEFVEVGDELGVVSPPGQSVSSGLPGQGSGKVAPGGVVNARDSIPVIAPIAGTLRGLLRDYSQIQPYARLAEIDPRPHVACHRASEQALAVGGGVLEAILGEFGKRPSPHHGVLARHARTGHGC